MVIKIHLYPLAVGALDDGKDQTALVYLWQVVEKL
jgi:hypothetical protein